MTAALDAILRHPAVWRGSQRAQIAGDVVPSGFAALDDVLPGGGWPCGALTEILPERAGIGELGLLMPALAQLSRQSGWQAWVAPRHVPYAPALAAAGIALARVLVVRPQTSGDAWWAAEQALRSGACCAMLAWLASPDERGMRRLQLAAEAGRSWCVLFRPARDVGQRSPAVLRLYLESAGDSLAVHVIKRRGGPVSRPLQIALAAGDASGPASFRQSGAPIEKSA